MTHPVYRLTTNKDESATSTFAQFRFMFYKYSQIGGLVQPERGHGSKVF